MQYLKNLGSQMFYVNSFIYYHNDEKLHISVIRTWTRTKTSIRYAKENYIEKRERKKGRRRDIEMQGEIREREREREREMWKG